MDTDTTRVQATQLLLRHPLATDGLAVHRLIAGCAPLDTNSAYCNLLQCLHFADTCMLAEEDDEVLGFVSAYRKPTDPDTLFVWQVAVDERARGKRLARTLLDAILSSPGAEGVKVIETTITADNAASWALFDGLARDKGQDKGERHVLFDQSRHFGGLHGSEILYRITLG
ncbi:diaminobutyrate acetyltransferase [Zobellella aerophila]|uniref:L-2,4-diaminobutyric acid acetyltransferase n=1 Tax=Zobellella aerophila TaxID=870480 RepID=A0ABP6V562_9GAMM